MPVRANAMLFGTLVHETIEDVHRAALRHEEQTITEENVSRWFDSKLCVAHESRAYISRGSSARGCFETSATLCEKAAR